MQDSGTGETPISRFGEQIAVQEVTPLYPVALTIAASKLQAAEKMEMYDDLVSYLIRRSICGLTPKNYRDFFARYGQELTAPQKAIAERLSAVRCSGNLTLLNLSVNRQAQNHAFTEKRDLLIANTNLRLNIPLIQRTSWSEADIAERGQLLTETASKLWPGPRT